MFTYPAEHLFFFALTLLWSYFIFPYPAEPFFSSHLSCCALILFSLTPWTRKGTSMGLNWTYYYFQDFRGLNHEFVSRRGASLDPGTDVVQTSVLKSEEAATSKFSSFSAESLGICQRGDGGFRRSRVAAIKSEPPLFTLRRFLLPFCFQGREICLFDELSPHRIELKKRWNLSLGQGCNA